MKNSKKQRIKELETQVQELNSKLNSFMQFVGYEGGEYTSMFEGATIKTVNVNISK